MSRKYSVAEIDALRYAVDKHYMYGRYQGARIDPGRSMAWSRSFIEADKVKIVEERVRTFMLGGITAQDLLAEEREREAEEGRHREEWLRAARERLDLETARANVAAVLAIT